MLDFHFTDGSVYTGEPLPDNIAGEGGYMWYLNESRVYNTAYGNLNDRCTRYLVEFKLTPDLIKLEEERINNLATIAGKIVGIGRIAYGYGFKPFFAGTYLPLLPVFRINHTGVKAIDLHFPIDEYIGKVHYSTVWTSKKIIHDYLT
jgi:hypothetical protein